MKHFSQRGFFCLFILLFAQQSFAQSNYIEGYVVTLSQDTLRGLIDNKDWERSPKYIKFRKDQAAEPIVYHPGQISAFYLSTNEYYLARSVSIDKSPVDVSRMTPRAQPLVVKDTVFLQASATGKVSLYYYVDESMKEHFYVQKEGSALDELILKRMLNEQNQLIVLERYKGQLSFYLSDCSEAQKAATRVTLQQSKLQKLITDYNVCVGGKGAGTSGNYSRKLEKLAIKPGLIVGYARTALSFRGSYLENIDFSSSKNPVLGASLNIGLLRSLRQWSLHNELLYRPYKLSGIEKIVEEIVFDLSYLKLVTMIRWKYPFGLVRPFVNLGMANSFALVAKSNALEDLRTYEFSLNGGLGAAIKKMSVEVRFERGNGISPFINLQSPTQTIYFILGYQF